VACNTLSCPTADIPIIGYTNSPKVCFGVAVLTDIDTTPIPESRPQDNGIVHIALQLRINLRSHQTGVLGPIC
jgi:hypothetical protein